MPLDHRARVWKFTIGKQLARIGWQRLSAMNLGSKQAKRKRKKLPIEEEEEEEEEKFRKELLILLQVIVSPRSRAISSARDANVRARARPLLKAP